MSTYRWHHSPTAGRRGVGVAVTTALVVVLCAAPGSAAPTSAVPSAVAPATDPQARDRAGLGLETVQPPVATPAAPDRVLVRFRADAPDQSRRSALSAVDATVDGTVGQTGFVAVDTAPGEAAAVAEELAADPRVADVQVDHVRAALGVQEWGNDTYVENQWPYLDLTTLPSAWEVSTGAGVKVAFLDTAITTTHPEFQGRVVPGYDAVDGDTDASGSAVHGTMVAGIAAAGADGNGIVGAAYKASVMPVRVLDDDGFGTDSTVAAGIDWASSHGAKVINLSLGGPDPSPVLEAALRTAVSRGSVVVVAAGNSDDEVLQYPAAYAADVPGVLSVSMTYDNGALVRDDRSWEGAIGSSWNDAVSIAAPGFDILGPTGANQHSIGTGTSFAAPLVSGAAALVLAKNPTWSPSKVAEQLMATARDAGPRGVDPYFGRGIVDAGAALGLTPAVPADRTVSDAARSDDVPARARAVTLPVEEEPVTLDGDGDVDWVRFDSQPATDYWIAVDHPSGPEVKVLDSDGRELGYSSDREHVFRSLDGGPVYVRVGPSEGWQATLSIRRYYDQRPADYVRFAPAEEVSVALTGSTFPEVVDVTGDGIVDVVSGFGGGRVRLTPGLPSGLFGPSVSVMLYPSHIRGDHFVVADVTGDALPEVVVLADYDVDVLTARGGAWQRLATHTVPGIFAPDAVDAGDLDGDGDLDLLVSLFTGLSVFRNVGGSFQPEAAALPAGEQNALTGGEHILVTEVDGTHGPDVLLADGRILLQQADGRFAVGLTRHPGWGRSRHVEVDGDGIPDVLVKGALLRGTASGGLAAPIAFPLDIATATFGDVNGDGRLDALENGRFSVRAADGTFGALQRLPYSPGQGVGATFARDLMGDERADILRNVDGTWQVLQQIDADDEPGDPEWVWSVTPAGFSSGVGVRPEITVTSRRQLSAAADDHLRLVGRDGRDVEVTRSVSADGSTVTLRPVADLVVGQHYEVIVSGLTDVDGAVQPEIVRSWFTVGAAGQRYTPVDPYRVLDTREGNGPISPGRHVDVYFDELVPDDATAVVLNVTAAAPRGNGFVRVFPTPDGGTVEPSTSSLNLAHGIDQPNLVTVKLGLDRGVRISAVWTTTDVVVDLAGYYGAGAATAYVPVSPVRVMDLRTGEAGGPKGKVAARSYVELQVAGRNGVPADATAVVLNVTGVNPPARTTVRVYPAPAPFEGNWMPEVSNLNLMPGRDQPNLVTVKVGWGGKVRLYAHNTDLFLVADLAGYYTPTGANGYTAMDPVRLADTRTGQGLPGGRMMPGVTRSLAVAGTNGIPADATGAVFNVTGARPGYLTVIRVFPAGPGEPPSISNLNLVPGRDDPNMVISRIGVGGKVSFYSHSAVTDLVVDVGGYFRTFS